VVPLRVSLAGAGGTESAVRRLDEISIAPALQMRLSSCMHFWKARLDGWRLQRAYADFNAKRRNRNVATYLVQVVSESRQVDTPKVWHTCIVFLTAKDVVKLVAKARCGRVKVVEFW
jgi:hypothetical protein